MHNTRVRIKCFLEYFFFIFTVIFIIYEKRDYVIVLYRDQQVKNLR